MYCVGDLMKEFLKMCNAINREHDSNRKQLDTQFKLIMSIYAIGIIGAIYLMFS